MKKLEIGTKVNVNLNSSDAGKLGINGAIFGLCTIADHYPLGHYVAMPGRKTPVAIADKYNAIEIV